MAHRVHFPPITANDTGYGIAWLTCSVCNRDKRADEFAEKTVPPVCDACREEYEWTNTDGGA